MSNNTDRPTQQQRNNSTESFVLDSGASGTYRGTYYPTAFDEESPNDGSNQDNRITLADGSVTVPTRRSQGNSEIFITEFKNEFTRLISVGALVQQHEHPADLLTRRIAIDGRIRQTYARHTTHVRPEQPSLNRIRLSAAGNRIQTVDISSAYCHTHAQDISHNGHQCGNENVRRQSRRR